jgi:hypothetical protein
MKKCLLLYCLSFICVIYTNAQITIDYSNTPVIGNIAIENVDTVFTGITPGSAGANQTWDFSGLITHTKDTSAFVDPSTLEGASDFPTANIGVRSNGAQNMFANSNSSSFDILGLHGDFGSMAGVLSVVLNPYKRLFTFPTTYLTTGSGTYTYQIQVAYSIPPYIDSARMVSSVVYNNNIDGWGTITTPAYSNVSCLRQVVREINTTTSYVHALGSWSVYGTPTVDTTYTYSWWSDTHNYTLAEIEVKGDTVSSAKYLYSLITDINKNSSNINSINVYPNPASNFINVSGVNENCYMIIHSIDGKIVSNVFMKENQNQISISKLINGMYFYNIINLNGDIISKGKFEVVKN